MFDVNVDMKKEKILLSDMFSTHLSISMEIVEFPTQAPGKLPTDVSFEVVHDRHLFLIQIFNVGNSLNIVKYNLKNTIN